MNKSLGVSYEGTAAIVATLGWNMNVTPWVTGSSAQRVKMFYGATKLGNFGLFGSLCSMALQFLLRKMKTGWCKCESLQFCLLVGFLLLVPVSGDQESHLNTANLLVVDLQLLA